MIGRKADLLFFIAISQIFVVYCTERRPLNKFIRHYEPLSYDEGKLKTSFKDGEEFKSLEFNAHGRNFKLQVKKDQETFSPGVETSSKEAADLVHSAVVGQLEDDKHSEVFGSIKDGKFEGAIFTRDDEYNVKPAKYFFDDPQEFHSVIYRSKDVVNSFLKDKADDIVSRFTKRHRNRRESPEFDYPEKFDLYDHENTKNLRICNLSLEADYLFTEIMGNDTGRAVGEMVYLVRVANRKFEEMAETDYWKKSKSFKVRLMVGRVIAYTYSTTPKTLLTPSMGAATFLDHVSDLDYNGFCQAFFFTYRDFEGGITGLTWSKYGQEKGGICEPRRYFIRIFEYYSIQKQKSFNTGVITYKFYGGYIPPKMGEIAFLRQVGTAFGARDDPDTPECRPGLTSDDKGYSNHISGNYIMYDKATNGGRDNNDKFSPCSVRDIVKTINSPEVLNRIVNDDRILKIFCMELPKKIIERRPKCGDGVRHYYEQCDCGSVEECSIKEPGGCCNQKTCTLREGATCTVNDGPCCDTTTCSHRPANYVCRPGDECAFQATCNNLRGFDNYQCPARVKKGDFKPCATESQVCIDGICSNSVCRRYGLKECQCMEKKSQCSVCCMFLGKCVPALNIPVVTGFRKGTLPMGAPCANNTGYCDLFHVCQEVDISLPLKRITELYYIREDVRTWVRKYWYAPLLFTAFMITVVCLLIFCCTKYAVVQTSVPKKRTDMQMTLLK